MSRMPSTLLTLLTVALLGTWIASCSEDSTTTCVPGITRLCAGVGRCQGSQVCLSDGSGYGECDCSAAPEDMMSMPEETELTVVGRPCTSNDQCGDGLTCLTADGNDFFGGGAPNGYCTATCTANTDCTSIDPQSDCFNEETTGTGLCIRQCLSKDPESIAENKCLGRHDVICNSEVVYGLADRSIQRQRGWCIPQCTSDEDCGDRRCSLATGLCVDTLPTGAALGERCDDNADCASRDCVQVGNEGHSFCSAPCQVGSPVGCGYGLSASPREAACLFARITGGTFGLEDEGLGDLGFCSELCDQDTDCAQNADGGWFCLEVGAVSQLFGRQGFCADPSSQQPLPDAGVPDGGAGVPDGGAAPTDASSDPNPGVADASPAEDAG